MVGTCGTPVGDVGPPWTMGTGVLRTDGQPRNCEEEAGPQCRPSGGSGGGQGLLSRIGPGFGPHWDPNWVSAGSQMGPKWVPVGAWGRKIGAGRTVGSNPSMPQSTVWYIPIMVGVVPNMVGVVPIMVGVVPIMVGVVPIMVGVVPIMVGVVPIMVGVDRSTLLIEWLLLVAT